MRPLIDTKRQENIKQLEKRSKTKNKHKPTNVGRIALEGEAMQFNSGAVA